MDQEIYTNNSSLQALIFSKERYTYEEATKWLKDYKYDPWDNYMPDDYTPYTQTSKTHRFIFGCPRRYFLYDIVKKDSITRVYGDLFGKHRHY